jgi:tetratricopeptide (TPR) repeat protein
MTLSAFRYRAWILVGIAVLASAAVAQRIGPGNPNIPSRTNPSRTPSGPDITAQPVFISGKVLLEGGGTLPEPVAIERVCNNVSRREGYTDGKGQFEFQLGLNTTFQDASEENDSRAASTQTRQTSNRTRRPLDLTGCEFRAVLAGYQSSLAIVRTSGEGWQYDIGTIFLKRIGTATGTTISLTSMAAPKNAMHAYEKAEKTAPENPVEAEKELHKAVQVYPQFAAAWNLLGDIHLQNKQLDLARSDYTHAISADPQYVNPAYGLSMIAMQEKKWAEAAQISEQVLKMNAMAFPLAYFFNAAANYNQQRYDDAEQSAKKFKALDTQHRHPDVCLLLSHIYSRKQDYTGAARELRDYLAAEPDAPDAESIKVEAKRFEDLSVSAKRN